MLDLSRHDGTLHALALESVNQPGKFSQRKPMNGGSMVFDFGEGFFLDGRDDDFVAFSAGCVEHQKRKAAVAGNETELPFTVRHCPPV